MYPNHTTPAIEANVRDLQSNQLIQQLFANKKGCTLLNESDLLKIAKSVKRIQIPPNKTLFKQGSAGMTAGILVKGKLFGRIVYEDLTEPVAFSIEAGKMYGEISLVTGLKRSATLYTKTEAVEILELSVESFVLLLSLHPDIPRLLTRMIQRRYTSNKAQYQRLHSIPEKELEDTFGRKNLLKRFLDVLKKKGV